ncbi:redoxin domain-containing protein [Pedobacter aquatilis]|uniref:TlpA family protein disulfide reductase n=1 Tax=Pedobacter aquatilis TaxID=351343 RepID=UPI0025B46F94|nr:redoxin domain-containing protein [Pedobacter aquatilis]MDN3588054.1 redoxin domain-containing protein [Pedobacter aquatilis]
MRSKIFLIAAIACLNLATVAQEKYIPRLKVGDSVPELYFPVIVNSELKTAKLSDFRGKLVILDYWNKWCSSCISGFQKYSRLMNKHGAEMIVLPVSFLHTKAEVNTFLESRKQLKDTISLPFAVFENKDNSLFKMLPTTGYPFSIWISKTGRILHLSSYSATEEASILNGLKGYPSGYLGSVQDMNFSKTRPLLVDGNGGPDSAFIYRSMITPYNDKIPASSGANLKSGNISRIWMYNAPVLELLKFAEKEGNTDDPFNLNIVLEGDVAARLTFARPKVEKQGWLRKNGYCYELIQPGRLSRADAFAKMRTDLSDFFKIRFQSENRLMPVMVLRQTDSLHRFKAVSAKTGIIRLPGNVLEINRRKMDDVIAYLQVAGAPALGNGTGYESEVDIKINLPVPFDISLLNEQLEVYGLKFFPEMRTRRVIVISEK